MTSSWIPAGALALLAALAGCGSSKPYIWADQVPPADAGDSSGYRVSAGDIISVRVWNQDAMSVARVRVREDGKIALPFLRDVTVIGLSPDDLEARLELELGKYVLKPMVTVALEEPAPIRVSVLGEVSKPGAYELTTRTPGVLQALAAANGLTEYAPHDGIYILRRSPTKLLRIRFRYDDLTAGGRSASFTVENGDVIVVE